MFAQNSFSFEHTQLSSLKTNLYIISYQIENNRREISLDYDGLPRSPFETADVLRKIGKQSTESDSVFLEMFETPSLLSNKGNIVCVCVCVCVCVEK